MDRTRLVLIMVIALFILGLAVFSLYFDDHYLLISLCLVLVAMAPFFVRFEQKALHAREIVLIAMLVAIAAVSRVPFAAIPSVQPTSFIIIVSALVFGAESGFMIGALAALVSNMFLGQGPWTPWQMFGWGAIGLTAGWLRNTRWMSNRWGMMSFGFAWGFGFGWITNFFVVIGILHNFTWTQFLALYATSVYFDLLHALSNVFFLGLFGVGWIKIMQRFKKKYGLLQ